MLNKVHYGLESIGITNEPLGLSYNWSAGNWNLNGESEMLSEVETNKDKLLQKLKANLENHKKIYEEAKLGYLDKAIEACDKQKGELMTGKLVNLNINLSPPTSHEKEYKQAIEMLEWSDNQVLRLTAQQFRQYVLDDWDWSRQFFLSNVGYSSTAASGCSTRGYN